MKSIKSSVISKLSVAILASVSLISCQDDSIQGKWVEPIPGQQGVQGIELQKDGKATSINMATLKYESWKKQDNNLILNGQSIGNGQTINFSDTLHIKELTPEKLILQKKDLIIKYDKQK